MQAKLDGCSGMMTSVIASKLSSMADRSASRVCRSRSTSGLEQDDVRQDLLVDLLCRLPSYDEFRGSLWPFAAMCFRHRSGRLIRVAARNQSARHPADLDAPTPGSPHVALVDTLTEGEGFGSWVGQPVDQVAHLEARLDLASLLAGLPLDAIKLCGLLMEGRQPLARVAGASLATIYRRRHDLRCQLLAAGIGPLRDKGRPPRGTLKAGNDYRPALTNCTAGLTEAALCAWVGQAYTGEQLVYHRGFLAIDAGPDSAVLTLTEISQLRRVANQAIQLLEKGLVHLDQRREAISDYSYIMVARSRPKSQARTGALEQVLERAGLSETKKPVRRSA